MELVRNYEKLSKPFNHFYYFIYAGLIYWTGGVHDDDGYFWQGSQTDLIPEVEAKIEGTNPGKLEQLYFSHDSSRRFHMNLKPNSNPEAYICEVKRSSASTTTTTTLPTPACTISIHNTEVCTDK